MSHLTYFPLNKECSVLFKGDATRYEGQFKKMVTKNQVIFFGNDRSITIIAKLPGAGTKGEVSSIRVL